MYYTYGLISKSGNRTYTGSTVDLRERLTEHNSGKVKSSAPYAPYAVLHVEEFKALKEAYKKEKFYTSTSGRRIIKKFIENKRNLSM